MGSSAPFLEIFAKLPAAQSGVPFADFMELALYHPTVGYYTGPRRRVGRDRGADFYTATSFNPVFGELVVAAAAELLGPGRAAAHRFVEIGAEPGGGVLRGIAHPFAGERTVSLGQPIEIAGPCVVFSNELFDAQPFHSVVFRDGRWRELGVALADGQLRETELPAPCPEVAAFADRLPRAAPEGYRLDLPLRTVPLLDRIAGQPWTGLFLAFDYGRSWTQLVEDFPIGTGRTYSKQRMGGDLLARPGEVDITCHICWDWLADALQRQGFGEAVVESQEAFFARHAAAALAPMMAAEAARFSPRKQAILQLLHPGNMGQKFQALHALRR
ncbi:MAG TPA: SAM-dependent methyltransferase [Opitutaceae bacterium]|nr:SAM-dependent methyltransferase [Opitutaceae bacterium]